MAQTGRTGKQGQPKECHRRNSMQSRLDLVRGHHQGQQSALTALTGRTDDCTRRMSDHHFSLATWEPSTDAIPHLSATDKNLNRPQGSAFEADTDVFEGTLCRFHLVAEPFAECAISGRAGLLYQSP